MIIYQAALLLTCCASISAQLRAETTKVGSRGLMSFDLIAGYQPTSLVTDPNAIDLDQQAMQVQLALKTTAGFEKARKIYQEGGNSMTFAVLTLTTPLANAITKGTVISGQSATSQTVTGTALEDAAIGATTLKMLYDVGSTQATHSTCKVGGLVTTTTTGCLKDSGSVTVNSVVLSYSYVTTDNNDNGRTLQGFSTSANTKMKVNGVGSFYEDFQKAVSYYGTFDYGDKLVSGAFDGASVTLNGKDFNLASYGFNGRDQIIKKGTSYIFLPMHVIATLENALDKCAAACPTCNNEAVALLDEAVALYTGSLEGADGLGTGVLLYNFADIRCPGFKTCGANGDSTTGTSKVNIDIFAQFNSMKTSLGSGQCATARTQKETISKKLLVPLIQGAIRYAWVQRNPATETAEAEGIAFAFSVLPYLHVCNPSDAAYIFDQLKPDSGNTADHLAVKAAFENNYACIGITCADVGGLYNSTSSSYILQPCGASSPTKTNGNCFSGANQVDVLGKGLIAMDSLKIGDFVMAGKNKYSRVYSFSHLDVNAEVDYLQIYTDGLDEPLELSKEHMLFLHPDQLAVRASNIKVGDVLRGGQNTLVVTNVQWIKRLGAYAPVTESGDILVSGILASSYVSLLDGISPSMLNQHGLAHSVLSVHRMACTWNFGWCENETYNDDGLSPFVVAITFMTRIINMLRFTASKITVVMLVLPVIGFMYSLELLVKSSGLLVVSMALGFITFNKLTSVKKTC